MIIEALEAFLLAAKEETYVTGPQATEKPSRPGSRDRSFRVGDWFYRDSSFGAHNILGQEVVWHRREPVWAMNYYGWIARDEHITVAAAGEVIAAGLSATLREGRFLGGYEARVGDFTYLDASTGDVAHFEGRRRIEKPGVGTVHELVYHGGLVRTE